MNHIQPYIRSIFSPVQSVSKPVGFDRNPIDAAKAADSFNGKEVRFGALTDERLLKTNTHSLGRLDTFI